MDLRIKGKRALVMGASQGLGFAVAQSLKNEGVKVAICSRTEARIQEAAKKIGADLAFACDVAEIRGSKKAVSKVIEAWGGVDILIVNNGGPPKGLFTEVSEESWKEGFQNLWMSVVDSVQTALPKMKEQKWGRIMVITSAAAKEPIPGLTVSNGLRAGLLGLLKSLSAEVAIHGITVNALLPGYTRTERLMELGIPEEKITQQIPAGRLGEPEEFASLVTYLASEQAAYMTGQSISCDGGVIRGV